MLCARCFGTSHYAMLLSMHVTGCSIFSTVQLFCPDYTLLLELHALTLSRPFLCALAISIVTQVLNHTPKVHPSSLSVILMYNPLPMFCRLSTKKRGEPGTSSHMPDIRTILIFGGAHLTLVLVRMWGVVLVPVSHATSFHHLSWKEMKTRDGD